MDVRPSTKAAAVATDEAILERLRAGDEAAFSSLVETHHGALVRLAETFVGSRAIAEEVAQDAWMAILEGLARFERRSSLKTWIFRILMNRARTRFVREARSISFADLGEEPSPAAVDPTRFDARGAWSTAPRLHDDATPERFAADAEVRALVEAEIERLPPNQRAVVLLRDVEGLDSTDVCNILELQETYQRVLLHRGRARLRAVLERHLDRT